jgi:DNA-binding NarL/FixJ family response regulator
MRAATVLLEPAQPEAPRVELALAVALEQLGVPAFLLARDGQVQVANAAGQRRLEAGSREVMRALSAAIAGRPTAIRTEVTPLRHHGLTEGWLATFPSSSPQELTSERVQLAARRWRLTNGQTRVLDLVARGLTNATIADELAVTGRTVEVHVTAIFDKAGVENRSALVARVFTD